jgi:hypothetical protein
MENINSEFVSRRFPTSEAKLAYETTIPATKQISKTDYDICFAIPYGKKAFLWHTFYEDQKVAFLIEINRENQFGEVTKLGFSPMKNADFELGTIVSGVLYEEDMQEKTRKIFVMDDIHMHKGHPLSRKTFREKSGYLYDFLQNQAYDLRIVLPIFGNTEQENLQDKIDRIPYNIRHFQYRSSSHILPHLCMSALKKPGFGVPSMGSAATVTSTVITVASANSNTNAKKYKMNWRFDFSKPAYRRTALFYVKADPMFDVYFLGAMQEKTIVYCQNALIQNYKSSVLLNSLFRNIRENANIDAIEESDDEEDFEDVRENKYVDLEKEVIMECVFHYKFKKWMPIRVVSPGSREKVISIFSL